MNNVSPRAAGLLIRHRWPLLAVAALLTAVAVWPASRLKFDRSIENVFAPGDPLLVSYRRLKRTFGGNEIVLAAYTDEQLFAADGEGIRRVKRVREKLERVPGVKSVLSIDRPLGEQIVQPDSRIAARVRELFAGYTHGSEGETVALACMLLPREETPVGRRETIAGLRDVMRNQLPEPLSPGMIAGEPVMVTDGYRYVEEDGRRLGWATTLLLAVVIVVCFRSLRWLVVPVVIVQLTLLWTKAVLVVSGLRLSMVSSMLTAVVTVIGVATVVHVIVRFRQARSEKLSPENALLQAMTILILPIVWACCTDAAGFGALLVSRVGPIQDFGVMMAIGSLLVIASVALVLPALALWGRFSSDPKRAWGETLLDTQLDRLVGWVEHHPWLIGAGALAATLACATGISRLDVETDFTKNFRGDSRIVRSYAFVEERLGGAGVWDVMLPAPEKLDWQYLRRVRQLEQRLRSEVVVAEDGRTRPGLAKVLSLASAVEATQPGVLKAIDVTNTLPFMSEEQTRQAILAKRNIEMTVALAEMRRRTPTFYAALYNNDPQEGGHWLRIMLRSRERQPSQAKKQLIAEVMRISRQEFPPGEDGRAAEVTGFFVLLTFLIDSMLADQWLAFGVACVGIFLMMLIAFRNPLFAAVALVPNGLPILVVLGLMGWAGLKINMGAAMIAAVSMGLSIDSSIHYITSFQRARADGKDVHSALSSVHHTVGRALIFATLALIAGFSVLCFSEFVPTIYFGALVSLTMLGGLAGNLIVLPLLLKLVTREGASMAGKSTQPKEERVDTASG